MSSNWLHSDEVLEISSSSDSNIDNGSYPDTPSSDHDYNPNDFASDDDWARNMEILDLCDSSSSDDDEHPTKKRKLNPVIDLTKATDNILKPKSVVPDQPFSLFSNTGPFIRHKTPNMSMILPKLPDDNSDGIDLDKLDLPKPNLTDWEKCVRKPSFIPKNKL